jgi:hypothetical protein
MKKILVITTMLLVLHANLFAHSAGDSSAVYFSKEQFDNNNQQLKCACIIKEKAGFIWSYFGYEAEGLIRIKQGKELFYFQPDSIYGFIMNGIKFRYLPIEKRYVAVLSDTSPVTLFAAQHDGDGYHYKLSALMYLHPETGKLRAFNRKNMQSDFNTDKLLLSKMTALLIVLDGYKTDLSRKDFLKCQKLITPAR